MIMVNIFKIAIVLGVVCSCDTLHVVTTHAVLSLRISNTVNVVSCTSFYLKYIRVKMCVDMDQDAVEALHCVSLHQ